MSNIFGNFDSMPSDLSGATEYWYKLGFFVIPINMSKEKTPMIKWKPGSTAPKLDTLIDRVNHGGGLAIRVPMNMIVVDLDVDKKLTKKDPGYYVGLNNLTDMVINEDPDCLDTVTVHTATGGHHMYFSSQIPLGKTNSKTFGVSGIDTRVGPSGLVIVPPSYGENYVGRYVFDTEVKFIRPIPLFLSRKIMAQGFNPSGASIWENMEFADPTISDKTSPLGKHILKMACGSIENCPRGTRNQTIYDQSFKVFRSVASGLISVVDAESNLWQSARNRSLISGKGNDVPATIESAKTNGLTKPFNSGQIKAFERQAKLSSPK